MKSIFVIFLSVMFSVTAFAGKKDGKSIFNGKNLDGWVIHGTEKWYVQDGLLVCESGPDKAYGYLSTEKFYSDFVPSKVERKNTPLLPFASC